MMVYFHLELSRKPALLVIEFEFEFVVFFFLQCIIYLMSTRNSMTRAIASNRPPRHLPRSFLSVLLFIVIIKTFYT